MLVEIVVWNASYNMSSQIKCLIHKFFVSFQIFLGWISKQMNDEELISDGKALNNLNSNDYTFILVKISLFSWQSQKERQKQLFKWKKTKLKHLWLLNKKKTIFFLNFDVSSTIESIRNGRDIGL